MGIGLLHPAGSSCVGRALVSFNDEHFCQPEQHPAKRADRRKTRSVAHVVVTAMETPMTEVAFEA
jgi:hypothetical protein